jgi:RNA polymerase sigma-70 factor (ECF subfamily)
MQSPETRPSLILKLREPGHEQAWGEFVMAYEPFLKRLVERLGVPSRHVPDAVQQILAAVVQSVEQWSDDGDPESFRRWIQRVSRNVVIKFMTRERRQVAGRGGTDLLGQLQEIPEQPSQEQLRRYEFELIVWAAERVRDEFQATSWAAFWQTLVEGLPVAEVARNLGVSPGSIYMSRSRIMARIRRQVSDVLED